MSGAAPAPAPTPGAAPAPTPGAAPAPALLRVNALSGGYYKKEVFSEVSFEVAPGEFVCIIGANGCGKTTVLKTILGLLKPFAGDVLIDGRSTSHLAEKELARLIAYIPQTHTPPFPFEVADVVLLGRTPYVNRLAVVTDHDRQVAYRALTQLGIEQLAERTYTKLSGGQQQLVLIARAITQQPRLLVMDEPTASLDFGNQQLVLSRMRSLANEGMSVLMVTHDPAHAFYCADRVIVMHEGQVLMSGTPREAITTERMQQIYHAQVAVVDVEIAPGVREPACLPLKPS
ncbi:MAG: ABC transporter ATP-binding protein [Coriobacteriales bacterium]|jgi:iron complex transport system ATP-binding protein|nr:ABC transporter ATP-binding protein [Coriobacteriales bacterium]